MAINWQLIEYRNPRYNQSEGIDAEINIENQGWTWFTAPDGHELFLRIEGDGNVAPYEPTPMPSIVPFKISRRQFYTALALNGTITTGEAMMAMQGQLPEALAAIVASLPTPNEQFMATMLLTGAQEFESTHPLVAVFQTAQDWNDQQVNDFFAGASEL